MEFLTDNLASALALAIEQQAKTEQEAGFTGESALLAGWKDLHNKLVNHEITAIPLKD